MKNENIPADIKSKSLKEARKEIDVILGKLENQHDKLDESISKCKKIFISLETFIFISVFYCHVQSIAFVVSNGIFW